MFSSSGGSGTRFSSRWRKPPNNSPRSALQADFFKQDEALRPEDLGRLESELLEDFVARSSELLGPLAGELPLKRLVVFPNVSEGTVDEVVMLRSGETAHVLSRTPPGAVRAFHAAAGSAGAAALPEPGLHHLRRAFTPESEVPDVLRGPHADGPQHRGGPARRVSSISIRNGA